MAEANARWENRHFAPLKAALDTLVDPSLMVVVPATEKPVAVLVNVSVAFVRNEPVFPEPIPCWTATPGLSAPERTNVVFAFSPLAKVLLICTLVGLITLRLPWKFSWVVFPASVLFSVPAMV